MTVTPVFLLMRACPADSACSTGNGPVSGTSKSLTLNNGTAERMYMLHPNRMKALDAAILRGFTDPIEASHADRESRTREITIVYSFIGAFDFSCAIGGARRSNQKQQETA